MINRTVAQLADMSGAILKSEQKDIIIKGIKTDSRQLAGELYVPIVGERFNGHDFVHQAVENGAKAVLWNKSVPMPDDLPHIPFLRVRDTLTALQKLAAAYRSELFTRVVAITGSNGKTTTKDMTAALLSTQYKVQKTEGNLNNHIGLPLTLLALEEDTDIAVVELGMSGFGEIELLTQIAQPDLALITNIGDAHMLQLGSREGIAKAKLEIVQGLGDDGILLYNGDEKLLYEQLENMSILDTIQQKTFGLNENNDWSATQIELDALGSRFIVQNLGKQSSVGQQHIGIPGRHNVSNALGAIAVARLFGVPATQIQAGFEGMQLTSMRIAPTKTWNGATLLNDAYNANPTAAYAAIDLVASLTGFRKKWLVLADMLELGPDEARYHRELGEYAMNKQVDGLLAYGDLAQHIVEGARVLATGEESILWFAEKQQLIDWLVSHIASDDLILVKGSRGMKMEEVVEALEKG